MCWWHLYARFTSAKRAKQLKQRMKKQSLLLQLTPWACHAWALLPALFVLEVWQAPGAEIWNGPSINFTNQVGSDPTLPANQDRLTLNVWLTRGFTRGLYNAAAETSFSSLSPVGTEWAYGALSDYAALNYQNWQAWNGKSPPSMVGQNAVLHLIPDDVYLAIRFTSWNMGGGGFSYTRSTSPVPEPPAALMMLAGTSALAGLRFYGRRRRA
jgi:hypothetical protein